MTDDDGCVPHLYPYATEHDWETLVAGSEVGGRVEFQTVAEQRCRDCGWRVRIVTDLRTIAEPPSTA